MNATIRVYGPPRDTAGVIACIVELQEFERTIEPTLPRGTDMAEAYHAYLMEQCAECDGVVYVAEMGDRVVGYVSVWAHVISRGIDDSREPYAYVSDLVLLPEARGRGWGRALLARAEEYARERGARTLRIAVLAENTVARDLYLTLGFRERSVVLAKSLR